MSNIHHIVKILSIQELLSQFQTEELEIIRGRKRADT